MNTLIGNKVKLRALEPEDLEFLYDLENDESFWHLSNTQSPFSKFILKQYLENTHLDIYEVKQLRLVIQEKKTLTPIGLIDLFEFNPQNKRAGVGIILKEKYQSKGYASEALELLIKFSFSHLQVHQLFANISSNNSKSIALFTKHNFVKVGVKKDWNFNGKNFYDEIFYQLIKS